MRELLLGLALLLAPMAGCITSDELSIEQPDLPTGLLLSYEVTSENETAREVFLVHNASSVGTELFAYELSRPNLTSPLLSFDADFQPQASGWSEVFDFPLQDGSEHEATIAGSQATVAWSTIGYEGPLDIESELEGVARANGSTIATFRFAGEGPAVLTYVDIDAPDGTQQRWELVDAELDSRWNHAPQWTKGDWWTYAGSFKNEEGQAQIVYTNDAESSRGAPQYVLNSVEVEDRVLMLPFQQWRKGDLAPRSGFINSMLSSFWNWPLHDGKQWTGSSGALPEGGSYVATSHLSDRVLLPDGTTSLAFTIEARSGEGELLATYQYAPLVEHLTQWRISEPEAEEPVLDLSLEDWGRAYHGEMEVPQRAVVAEVPDDGRSVASGPEEIERTFQVTERANRLQIASESFAVHGSNPDPQFTFRVIDPNGTVVFERNASDFNNRRIGLAQVLNAEAGQWRLEVTLGEDVSIIARIYANWFITQTVDFR